MKIISKSIFCSVIFAMIIFCIISNTLAQIPQEKLENPGSGAFPTGQMGYSIAVDGNTMIVGAPTTTSSLVTNTGAIKEYPKAGSARIYSKGIDGRWNLEADLTASPALASNWLGHSVAISGSTAVVAAQDGWNASKYTYAGSVYVFTRSLAGVWTQQAKLSGSPNAWDGGFGVHQCQFRETRWL